MSILSDLSNTPHSILQSLSSNLNECMLHVYPGASLYVYQSVYMWVLSFAKESCSFLLFWIGIYHSITVFLSSDLIFSDPICSYPISSSLFVSLGVRSHTTSISIVRYEVRENISEEEEQERHIPRHGF